MDLVVLEGSLTGVLVSWDLSVSKDTHRYPTADPNNSHSEATIGFIKHVRDVTRVLLICCLVTKSKLFFDPMDYSPPGLLSMGFFRQEYWSGSPVPFPGYLPNPGIKPASSALAGGFFTLLLLVTDLFLAISN